MQFLNISTIFIIAKESMYKTVKFCVRYNGSYSEFISSKVGVKQGDSSSMLLFFNDLMTSIDSNTNGIFTYDDAKLFTVLF